MRLVRRRILWLSAAVLLAVATGGIWLLALESRINRENYALIRHGMTAEHVYAIFGQSRPAISKADPVWSNTWHDGPNWIAVNFMLGEARNKEIHLATPWQMLNWYARKGAEKIGVKWE